MANPMKLSRSLSVFSAFLAAASLALAATTGSDAIPARITQQLQEKTLVTLPGNTHRLIATAKDLGPAPASMPTGRMILVLRHSAEQEASLQTFLQAVQNPADPEFHHWLTPEEFGARYGVSQADLAAVTGWLGSHGFAVDNVAKNRLTIEFSGTAAQVAAAFHTQIHSYLIGGEKHWANASDPQIPAALAPVIAGVAAMNDFRPKSLAVRGPSGHYDASTGKITPDVTYPRTHFTPDFLYVGPADAATIYNTPNALNPNASGTKYDGTGITIGIAGDSNITLAQNDNYRATFGLPVNHTQVVLAGPDPGVNGDAIEAYLDTQVAGGLAPGATVILYTSDNTTVSYGLFLAINRALDDNVADILNVSFGGCEASQGSFNQYINTVWEAAAAQGITVTVSSGDSGSAGCDDPNTESQAQYGLAVNGLGSTPYNVIVGGTDFDTLYGNFPTYVDTTNTLAHHRSAKSYIPEEPWNNSTFIGSNGSLANNKTWASMGYSGDGIVGGGGGVSLVYSEPSWQSGFAKDLSGRNVPDVSFLAANALYGAIWGLCTDLDSGVDCAGNPQTGNNFNLTGVGGTSAAAPAFAGMLALVAQKQGGRLGQADYVLYNLANTKYSTVFHDVTTGNNSVYCFTGTSNCALNSNNFPYLTGYDAGTGYDEASGLGSVDVSQLATNWANAGLISTTSALTLNGGTSTVSITHGATVTVGGHVTPGSGSTVTGDVALVDSLSAATFPNNEGITAFSLSGGAFSGTTTYLPGGTYTVKAHYGGSPADAASDSNAISVSVAPESSSTAVSSGGCYDPQTNSVAATVNYGYYCYVDAEPYGNSATAANPNGYAIGTVTFKGSGTTLGTAPVMSNGIAEFATAVLPPGSNTVTASFPGDNSFKASTGTLAGVVNKAVTSSSLSLSTPSITAGSQVTLTGSLATDSLGGAPTGTVSFMDGATTVNSATLAGSAATSSALAAGQAQFTSSAFTSGPHTLSAVYNGDSNYAASAASTPILLNVAAASTTVTVMPASSSITASQSLSVSISLTTATGLSAPTGAVTLSAPGTSGTYTSAATNLAAGTATIVIPANSLASGVDTLTVQYTGDTYYGTASGTANVTISSGGTLTPTVTVMPGASNVTSFPLNVTVAVTGSGATPTGTAKLSSGSYNSSSVPLTGGQAIFVLNAGNLANGPNILTVTYSGDSVYKSGTGTAPVLVLGSPTVTVTPASSTVTTDKSLAVTVSVSTLSPLPPPTGTITLIGGGYNSGATPLAAGSAQITIPAGALALGTDTLGATYSGDTNYNPAAGNTNVQVNAPTPGFSVAATNVTISSPGATTSNTSTLTVTPTNGFTGPITFGASITSSPSGAVYLPTFAVSPNPLTITGAAAQTTTLTVSTTAPTSAVVHAAGTMSRWLPAGILSLAALLLFGIPARRRNWRGMVAIILLLGALATGAVACGGGGSGGGGGGGGGGTPGTTAGSYTVTVTGTAGTVVQTTTFTVNVQ